MNEEKVTGFIRPIVICVFHDGNRILVGDGYDPTKQQVFYRPPGGAIHFGEPRETALRREMREELEVEIKNPRFLGVLENLFTFDGEQGHEIVFVFDAELEDESLYKVPSFKAHESNGETFNALWIDIDSIGPDTPPVYPEGLIGLLKNVQPAATRRRGQAARLSRAVRHRGP